MKRTPQETMFWFVPKANLALVASALFLAYELFVTVTATYTSANITAKRQRIRPLELTEKTAIARAAVPVFSEDIFKKSRLFNQSGPKRSFGGKRQFVLLGVSVGTKNIAVIKETVGNKSYYCSVGDSIEEFTVKEITKDRVVLESEGGTVEINR